MSPRKRLFTQQRRRSSALLFLPLVVALGLVAAACAPPAESPGSTTTTTTSTLPEPQGPEVVGQACRPGSGVTVVVDFTALDDTVKIGCAPGEQASGLAALGAAGFTVGSQSGAGTVCTVDGLPGAGFPYCWTTGGYWSYWKAPDRSVPWAFSQTGAGDGPIAEGAVEGWSWAPGFADAAPRVSVAGLAAVTPDPTLGECDVPDAPVLSIIASNETLRFTMSGDGPVELAVIAAAADPSTAQYEVADSLALSPYEGQIIRVLARSASPDCVVGDVFDATYDVRSSYAGRAPINADSPAVPTASASILGWADGHSEYTPGADVTPSFQNPSGGYGSAASGLVVLGNGGSITMTFAAPIADGAGDDFAIFENGFTQSTTSQLFFAELAYVEVSSNGSDFVRFDSASQQPTAVAAFGFQDPRLLGGLAGKDPAGYGTPFDLQALRNKSAVRNGSVDLASITHVRIVDVVGASDYPTVGDTYPDSFGRQILDAHKTTGSGGFDLTGVAVLNRAAALNRAG